jgi:hypothetical protein
MSTCRALHWRTAQLRAHGFEPVAMPMDAPHEPPEDYDFGERRVTAKEIPPVLYLEADQMDGTPEAETLRAAADILEARK